MRRFLKEHRRLFKWKANREVEERQWRGFFYVRVKQRHSDLVSDLTLLHIALFSAILGKKKITKQSRIFGHSSNAGYTLCDFQLSQTKYDHCDKNLAMSLVLALHQVQKVLIAFDKIMIVAEICDEYHTA